VLQRNDIVLTACQGTNADLIAEVARLYIKHGQKVCDPTFGKGVFWAKLDRSQFELSASDLITTEVKHDLRKLPYPDSTFDHFVFDPPYAHWPGKMRVEECYQNTLTTKAHSHDAILNLYRDGMVEARRVLKDRGMLWVKCQDEIEHGHQRWSHIEIKEIASALGFEAVDLFVLLQNTQPVYRHVAQKHARKNHSYMWMFLCHK
jgi:methylase of polypeptide subunit release factors